MTSGCQAYSVNYGPAKSFANSDMMRLAVYDQSSQTRRESTLSSSVPSSSLPSSLGGVPLCFVLGADDRSPSGTPQGLVRRYTFGAADPRDA